MGSGAGLNGELVEYLTQIVPKLNSLDFEIEYWNLYERCARVNGDLRELSSYAKRHSYLPVAEILFGLTISLKSYCITENKEALALALTHIRQTLTINNVYFYSLERMNLYLKI